MFQVSEPRSFLAKKKMETEHHEVRSWFADVFDHKVRQRHQREKLEFVVLIVNSQSSRTMRNRIECSSVHSQSVPHQTLHVKMCGSVVIARRSPFAPDG